MTLKVFGSIFLAASLGMGAAANADEAKSVAKLTDSSGTVMVDHGKGFVSTDLDAPLYENDRLITLDGSMAEVTFTDGCRTKLKSNNMIVININPGCKAALLDVSKGVPAAQQVAAVHPLSYVPPVVGGAIVLWAISDATDGFGQQ